jgi:hypothetical protein
MVRVFPFSVKSFLLSVLLHSFLLFFRVLTHTFLPVHPEDDDVGGEATFTGSWSVYPYFASGYIVVNSIERGLFVVKYNGGA